MATKSNEGVTKRIHDSLHKEILGVMKAIEESTGFDISYITASKLVAFKSRQFQRQLTIPETKQILSRK